MYNPSKDLILSILLLSGGNSLMNQKRSYSPFSRCGLGELTTRGVGHNDGMGDTGIGVGSNPFSAGDGHTPNERSQNQPEKMCHKTGYQHLEDRIHITNFQTKYFGISFGIELPISRSNTSVNRGFEPGNALLFLPLLLEKQTPHH
jgi:hypothetical protein